MTSSRSWRSGLRPDPRPQPRLYVSVDDLTLYPLFTDELIGLMRTLIEQDRQGAVATAIVLTAGSKQALPDSARPRPRARLGQRREDRLELTAQVLERGRKDERLAEVLESSSTEKRAERRSRRDAARLAE